MADLQRTYGDFLARGAGNKRDGGAEGNRFFENLAVKSLIWGFLWRMCPVFEVGFLVLLGNCGVVWIDLCLDYGHEEHVFLFSDLDELWLAVAGGVRGVC